MSNKGEIKHFFNKSEADVTRVDDPDIKQMEEVDRFSSVELDQLHLIYPGMDNQRVLNLFRELRTQLLQQAKKKNFICMVSSIGSGGGATYMTSNLGAAFALDKSKTSLLIDANLYAPALNKLVIGDVETGITDYLGDGCGQIRDIVYATGIPRLRVIPLGVNSEGAAEYFSSVKMTHFIDEIRSRYSDRFIFIDAPPILESSEARILAEIVDCVVLVVPHGRAVPDQIDAAISIVGTEKLAGLVYNN